MYMSTSLSVSSTTQAAAECLQHCSSRSLEFHSWL